MLCAGRDGEPGEHSSRREERIGLLRTVEGSLGETGDGASTGEHCGGWRRMDRGEKASSQKFRPRRNKSSHNPGFPRWRDPINFLGTAVLAPSALATTALRRSPARVHERARRCRRSSSQTSRTRYIRHVSHKAFTSPTFLWTTSTHVNTALSKRTPLS